MKLILFYEIFQCNQNINLSTVGLKAFTNVLKTWPSNEPYPAVLAYV